MVNENEVWKRQIRSHFVQAIYFGCFVLIGQIATGQGSLQSAASINESSQLRLSRIGNSVVGERIVSVTCDPFMSPSQEKALMRLLQEQDNLPWHNFSLQSLKARLSNSCSVLIDEKSIEDENILMNEPLMKEVPFGTLGARLSVLLDAKGLAYTIRQNRLEIGSKKGATMGVLSMSFVDCRHMSFSRVYLPKAVAELRFVGCALANKHWQQAIPQRLLNWSMSPLDWVLSGPLQNVVYKA